MRGDVGIDLDWIAEVTGARSARRAARLQSLWSGYGEIVRIELEGAEVDTVVVKSVMPPARPKSDVSHAGKRRSYDVERAFYTRFASRCDETCRVPRLVGSRSTETGWLFVLEDLDASGFGERRRGANAETLDRCLAWLAAFHARFMGVAPDGLWKVGTYWHLATRREELEGITDATIRALAPALAGKLNACRHRTLVHGDAKLANFCFARAGRVAAVDFQYVGGGAGVKDVAYLVAGAGPREESRAVDVYFAHLRRELGEAASPIEEEWRALYPFAMADFYRFLAGWSPPHFASDPSARGWLERAAALLGP